MVIVDVSGNNCLVPDVRRKTFNLLPLSKMLALSFSLRSFIMYLENPSDRQVQQGCGYKNQYT